MTCPYRRLKCLQDVATGVMTGCDHSKIERTMDDGSIEKVCPICDDVQVYTEDTEPTEDTESTEDDN